MAKRNALDIVNTDWDFEGLMSNLELIRTASLLVSAHELIRIRRALESLGHDGIHEVIKEQKQQIPMLRAARQKKTKRPIKKE